MKKMTFVLTAYLLQLCISCNKTHKMSEDIGLEKVIDIAANHYKGKTNIENYITDVNIIPLKYPKIIANIDKVILTQDKIYVQDEKTIALLEFTKDGTFIKQIGKLGAGPGEYLSIHDFEIDETTGHIFVMSLQSMALIEYDDQGLFIKALKLPVFAQKFKLAKDEILLFPNSNPNELSGNCDLIVFDRNLNHKQNLLCREKLSDFISSLSGDLSTNETGICVTKAFENKVYYYQNGVLNTKYSIDFGKSEFPLDYSYKFSSFRKYVSDYAYLSKPILENNHYLSFYYLNKDRITFFILDKKRNIAYDDATNFDYTGFNRAIAGYGIIGLKGDVFLAKIDMDSFDQKEVKLDSSLILRNIKAMNLKNHVLVSFKLNLP